MISSFYQLIDVIQKGEKEEELYSSHASSHTHDYIGSVIESTEGKNCFCSNHQRGKE